MTSFVRVALIAAVVALAGPAQAAYEAPRVTAKELKAQTLKDEAIYIIDVRSPQAYAAAHLPGAINIPWKGLRLGAKPPPLLPFRKAYFYCT